MTPGPNRTTIASEVFFLDEPRPDPLGKVGRTDFSALPDAENDVFDAFVRYRSLLRADETAPSLQLLQDKVARLARMAQACSDQIEDFQLTDADSRTRIEFRGAMNGLLFDHGLSQSQMHAALEETSESLYKLGMFLTAAQLALKARVDEGEVVDVSHPKSRHDFYRRLHVILDRHDLDRDVGENSLIVLLVIRLEKNWEPVARSGPEGSKEAERDRRRRKDLAAEIKTAVNAFQGG